MAATKKPFEREDRAGHLNNEHARSLLEKSGRHSDDDRAFVGKRHSSDDLAESLAEDAVSAMTTGEDAPTGTSDSEVPEDVGGPFVETTAGEEFAEGTDASNPRGAKREPFPKT